MKRLITFILIIASLSLGSGVFADSGNINRIPASGISGGSLGSLTYWTSATTLGATSSPTVGYITATSTTATSSFAAPASLSKTLTAPAAPTGLSVVEVGSGFSEYFIGDTVQYKIFCYKNTFGTRNYSQPVTSSLKTFTGDVDAMNITWTNPAGVDACLAVRNKNGAGFVDQIDPVVSTYTDDSPNVDAWNVGVGSPSPGGAINNYYNYNDGTNIFGVYSAGLGYFGGNLGIGTTSPYLPLSVVGAATISGNLSIGTVLSLGNNLNGTINIGTAGNNINLTGAGGVGFDFNYLTNGYLRFVIQGGDGPDFQAFGGTYPGGAGSGAGSFYFDYGSSARTLVGSAAHFRNLGGGGTTEPLTIYSNSSVGVSNATPSASYKLDVTGAIHATSLIDASNFVGTSTTLNSTFASKVGIATTSPYRALSVYGSSDLGTNALAGNFTATSTTATSTFATSIAIGTTTASTTFVYENTAVANATTTMTKGSSTHPSCDTWYSPNKSAWRVYMSNSGALITEAGVCPHN